MLAPIGSSGSSRLRALPALLILQAEEDLPDLAGGGTAPQELAQRHRDERSTHPHAILFGLRRRGRPVQAHEDGLIGNRKRYEVSVETQGEVPADE